MSKSRHGIVRVASKNPRVTSKELKASLALANVNVYKTITRRILNNNGVLGRVAKRKPILSKKNLATSLQFVKDQMDKPESYWKNLK